MTKAAVLVGGCAALLALSAWLQSAVLAPRADANAADSSAPMDYFIERFASVGVDDAGRRYRLAADRLEQRIGDGDHGARLHRVALVQYAADGAARRIRADSGWLRNDGAEVLLRGNVRVRENDGASTTRAQRMLIRLDADAAQ